MPNTRAAFLQIGSFSHSNANLLQALQKRFPQTEFDVIDVKRLLFRRIDLLFINLLFLLWEYFSFNFKANGNPKRRFFATTFIFQQMGALAVKQIAKRPYDFTIQTQSMFDAKVNHIPHFVYTDHTVLANFRYPNLPIALLKSQIFSPKWIELEQSIYKNATLNFSMSRFVASSIQEDYGCDVNRIVCVGAGGNVKLRTDLLQKNYAGKNILFVGMDWERKGGPELVEAFEQVLLIHPDARLTIVGCSPYVNLPNCTVVGRIAPEEVSQYYSDATVFCLPTRLEPFGFVFLEAMSYGLPVVATNVGAIPDMVQNGVNGYTVFPGNVDELSSVLCKLLSAPEACAEMGNNAYQKTKDVFNWDYVADQMWMHIIPHVAKLRHEYDSPGKKRLQKTTRNRKVRSVADRTS